MMVTIQFVSALLDQVVRGGTVHCVRVVSARLSMRQECVGGAGLGAGREQGGRWFHLWCFDDLAYLLAMHASTRGGGGILKETI